MGSDGTVADGEGSDVATGATGLDPADTVGDDIAGIVIAGAVDAAAGSFSVADRSEVQLATMMMELTPTIRRTSRAFTMDPKPTTSATTRVLKTSASSTSPSLAHTRLCMVHALDESTLAGGLQAMTVSGRIVITGATLASLLVWAAAPDHAAAAVTPTDSAVDLALALVDDPSYLVGSEIVTAPPTSGSLAIADEAIGGLPAGSVVMSSGRASRITEANTSGSSGDNLGGGSIRGNTDRDVTIFRLDLDVPDWVNCIVGIDFQFFSEEYPEYVGSGFNDGFIIELDESTWTTNGSAISAPRNIAFDQNGDIISINTSGLLTMTPEHAQGTTFDGATPPLRVRTPVEPGPHSLYFSVFDQGDNAYDSAVVIGEVNLGSVPDPDACQPGATVAGCTIEDIECFAPELRFDIGEGFFPMDPEDFVDRSALRWAADGRCTDGDAVERHPDAHLLALGAYEEYESDSSIKFWDCPRDDDTPFNTSQWTRPFGDETAENEVKRPNNGQGGTLTTREGFFLRWEGSDDPIGGVTDGLEIDAPVFVERDTDLLRYWIFFGNDPKSVLLPGDGILAHEGDWERVEIHFTDGQPTEISWYQHSCDPITRPWDEQYLTEGTHPVAYVSEGTHALYPHNNVRPQPLCGFLNLSGTTDHADYFDGFSRRWQSWNGDGVIPVNAACWYGFGGAWGDTAPVTSDLIGQESAATGPAGPPFKTKIADEFVAGTPGPECHDVIGLVDVGHADAEGAEFEWKDLLTVSVEGVEPGTVWSVVIHSVPTALGVIEVSADGTGTGSFEIPVGTPPGSHRVVIADPDTGTTEYSTPIWIEIPAECAVDDPDVPSANDVDGDFVLDRCDPWALDGPLADLDGDGVRNDTDNCVSVPNSDQAATDRRDTGDACNPRLGYNLTGDVEQPDHYGTPTCSWYIPTIIGTEGNDTINGTPGDDVILALGGDDTIRGNGGNDIICGGAGDDTIDTNNGEGNDIIDGGDGNDTIWAGHGTNSVTAGAGNDQVHTGDRDDNVDLGAGDDWVDAGHGTNTIIGGAGSDQITSRDGNDTIDAGDGDDTIWAGHGTNSVAAGGGNDQVHTGDRDDNVDLGAGDDWVDAGHGTNTIIGGAGSDQITTRDGNDTIDAGDGDDTVIAGHGTNVVTAANGNNTITTMSGPDHITTGGGDDTISSGDGDDTISSGAGNDTINAGNGNDTIID